MERIIRPNNSLLRGNLQELWYFRDLFYFFTWRDVKVKYKQTSIGILWAVFQPFITMVIFSVFFGKFARIPSEGIPYPVFVYAGLLFWTLFSSGLTHASNSFIENERIITKVYFPRIILPISSIFTTVVDFLIASVLLFVIMGYYGYVPSINTIWLYPLLLALTVFSSLGIGLFLASLNVKYRDVRFILPFFIQLLIFVTPVIYPMGIIAEKYQWVLALNPMVGIIDAARSGILGTKELDWLMLCMSFIFSFLYALIGFLYFKKAERYFADVI